MPKASIQLQVNGPPIVEIEGRTYEIENCTRSQVEVVPDLPYAMFFEYGQGRPWMFGRPPEYRGTLDFVPTIRYSKPNNGDYIDVDAEEIKEPAQLEAGPRQLKEHNE